MKVQINFEIIPIKVSQEFQGRIFNYPLHSLKKSKLCLTQTHCLVATTAAYNILREAVHQSSKFLLSKTMQCNYKVSTWQKVYITQQKKSYKWYAPWQHNKPEHILTSNSQLQMYLKWNVGRWKATPIYHMLSGGLIFQWKVMRTYLKFWINYSTRKHLINNLL